MGFFFLNIFLVLWDDGRCTHVSIFVYCFSLHVAMLVTKLTEVS